MSHLSGNSPKKGASWFSGRSLGRIWNGMGENGKEKMGGENDKHFMAMGMRNFRKKHYYLFFGRKNAPQTPQPTPDFATHIVTMERRDY